LASRARVENAPEALCGGPVLPHVAGRPRDPEHSMTAKMNALPPEFVYPFSVNVRVGSDNGHQVLVPIAFRSNANHKVLLDRALPLPC
jgi:hypothetical protein